MSEYDILLTVDTDSLVEEAYRLDQFAGTVGCRRCSPRLRRRAVWGAALWVVALSGLGTQLATVML